jgi:hypothetical protein
VIKVERSRVPGLEPSRVLFEDAAGLADLRARLDAAAAGSRPMLRGILLAALSRSGSDSELIPPPPLPWNRAARSSSTELMIELRRLLARHGRGPERTQDGNPEATMLATIDALVRASESIHARVAAASKS